MPKAKKTGSGKWRCRVVDHYEFNEGKRKIVYKSITANTKTGCELLAAEYAERKEETLNTNITLAQAIDAYITSKDSVLSPSTITGYNSLKKTAYESIQDLKVGSVRSEHLQMWINDYSRDHAPKTCRNAYGLLISVLGMYRPSVHFMVTLPQRRPPELYTPTDKDIKKLLDYIKGRELEKAVLISAFGTPRRGEVCAITYDDIHGDEIRINKAMVRTKEHGWLVKAPKTPESIRTIKYPRSVIDRLLVDASPGERIVNLVPDTITKSFREALDQCGLPHFRFHDLRAYAVSIRHAIGIPDVYIMQDGGYKTDAIMKQIYRRSMSDKREEFSKKAANHFSKMYGSKAKKKVNKKVNKLLQI